jgi:hypothetical protein
MRPKRYGDRPKASCVRPGARGQIAKKRARIRRSSAPFAQAFDPYDTYGSIERDRHDVANADRMAGSGRTLAVKPHETRSRKPPAASRRVCTMRACQSHLSIR